MGRYPDEFLKKLNDTANMYDIASEYTHLEPAGNNLFTGVCPLPGHDEKDASFTVFAHTNSWCCFGCDEAGNALSFLMKVNNWNFHQAVEHLCERLNIPKPNNHKFDKMYQENRTLELLYRRRLELNVENSLDYLLSRGLSKASIHKWGLGANGKNRIIFPLYDRDKNVIEFSMRYIIQPANKNDKYWHPANYLDDKRTVLKEYYNKASYLYGIHLYNAKIGDYVYFCEGALDAILADQYGLQNCLSTFGKNFTDGHLAFLQTTKKTPVFIYDNDESGIKGMHKACKKCEDAHITPYVVILDEGKDLADTANMLKENLVSFVEGQTMAYSYYLIQEALVAYKNTYKQFQNKYYRLFENCLMALDNEQYNIARAYIYEQTHLLIEAMKFRALTESVSYVYCTIDYVLSLYFKDLYELQKPYFKIFEEHLHRLSVEDYNYAKTFIQQVTGMLIEGET